jgi:hypothetical protein
MPRYIVKLDEFYFEWSTIVDAPVTYGVDRETFIKGYREAYPHEPPGMLDERMRRVDAFGSSRFDATAADILIAGNRAGPDGKCITKEEIIKLYKDPDA